MVHVIFDVNSIKVEDVLKAKVGGGRYIIGFPHQRGYGIQRGGSFWTSLIRELAPIGKSVGKALLSEGVATGARVINDLSHGVKLKEAVLNEGKEGVKNLIKKSVNKMSGGAKKRSVKRKRIVGRSVPRKAIKKRRVDSLGFY